MTWPRLRPWLSLCGVLAAGTAWGQTIDDPLMMGSRQLCTGLIYTHDSWTRYWEGTLERENGNIGTISTQAVSWMATYGLTDRVNVIAMVPWVATHASAGTLRGQQGFQDLAIAVKWNPLSAELTSRGTLSGFLVASAAGPVTDYTPDFLPLSIGLASRRAAARGSLSFRTHSGWFLEATGEYTWRGSVQLDRPYYYTDGALYFSDEVAMPNVVDYALRIGYWANHLFVPISFSQQITQGGGDIRRQDMPFVSNRMNATRLDALVVYWLPRAHNLAIRVGAAYTLSGRNVGQSTTLVGGFTYIVGF